MRSCNCNRGKQKMRKEQIRERLRKKLRMRKLHHSSHGDDFELARARTLLIQRLNYTKLKHHQQRKVDAVFVAYAKGRIPQLSQNFKHYVQTFIFVTNVGSKNFHRPSFMSVFEILANFLAPLRSISAREIYPFSGKFFHKWDQLIRLRKYAWREQIPIELAFTILLKKSWAALNYR